MGSKPSRRQPVATEPLDNETIQELCQETGFTRDELLEWHRNFYKDCPDGKLTLRQFEQEYAKIMGKPTPKTADYIKHMFNVYDEDKNNFIDFKEFVMALSAASAVNRLRLIETLFHVFDLDNDGKITKEEIGKMLHTLVDVTNSNDKQKDNSNQRERTKQNSLQQRIDDAFNELNANDDDHITKDEFIDWYMKSGLLSDVQSEEIHVTGPSDVQKIGKKSRRQVKLLGHTKSHNEQDENRMHGSQPVRHMSRMIERRVPSKYNDDDDNNIDGDNNKRTTTSVRLASLKQQLTDNDSDEENELDNSPIHSTASTTDAGLHASKENERWQHLFNSVLGQIRAQRLHGQLSYPSETESFKSWKREGEEKLKVEYMKQKSIGDKEKPSRESRSNLRPQTQKRTTDERTPSPDVVTIRF